ncbi:hypothetical protein KEM48_006071 [Puccinia striiformis f. sp. tritici PST-130]|nr:hypothetical protein KEM48_006071 [Puccinia striiformis f. sp. tritici PST-130]
MGQPAMIRFVTINNQHDPAELWRLLLDYYESNSPANQCRVYARFVGLAFRNYNIQQFLDELEQHIYHITAVGLVIGSKDSHVHIWEALFAEDIVKKFPDTLNSTREQLFSQRPMSINMVKKALIGAIASMKFF